MTIAHAVILLFNLLILSVSQADIPNKDVTNQIVDYMRPIIEEKTGKELDVYFYSRDMFIISTAVQKSSVEVYVWNAILTKLDKFEIGFLMCHEMGHVLGKVKIRSGRFKGLGLEGEADYFAGQCMLKLYTDLFGLDQGAAHEVAKKASLRALSIGYENKEIVPERALTIKFNGIKQDYPEPDCRGLSVLRGIENKSRPSCWHNP